MERRIRICETVSGIGELAERFVADTFGFAVFVVTVAFVAGAGTRALAGISVLGFVAVFLPMFVRHYFSYLARRLRVQHQFWD